METHGGVAHPILWLELVEIRTDVLWFEGCDSVLTCASRVFGGEGMVLPSDLR